MRRIGTRILLVGSGALLSLIGGALMLNPKLFLTMNEAIVEYEPSLMSEVTAPTGLMVITGAFMMLGAAKLRYANLGLLIGGIVYGSYGISRLISQKLHGMPSDQLIVATEIELFIAALLIALRVREFLNERDAVDTNFNEALT